MKKKREILPQSPIYQLLLWSGLLVGFGLRLFRLGAESFWYDETVSVYLAQQSIPDLLAHTARDIHPPGYYLLLHAWQALTAPSLQHGLEFLYAWPSLVGGMLLLPLLFALGRRWFGHRVALTALWLGALHPFALWYSQEVRMYTVGAALGLLCLWSADKWLVDRRQRALVVYTASGAAALYVLYYAAFALAAINLVFISRILLAPSTLPQRRRTLLQWIVAQVGVLVLWLPWLPIAWRQVTDPPVPPWRGDVDLGAAIGESLSALLVGQSGQGFYVLVIMIVLFVFFVYAKQNILARVTVFFYIFAPLILILGLSAFVTPLYHVRYFFTYAALAPLLLAVSIDVLKRWPLGHLAAVTVLLGLSVWSLAEFWQNLLYRADDHRTAVQTLAASWRPNDAILVNAGWVYPVLSVYWPEDASSTLSAVPPPLQDHIRLTDYANKINGPSLLTTGSVDGPTSLGWGLAESDFYAMPAAQADAALQRVAADHARIWHYRLYDTVSDPTGLLRAALDQLGGLAVDMPFVGRDFVRLQRYDLPAADVIFCPEDGVGTRYGDVLRLVGSDVPEVARSGEFLYATLCWEALESVNAYPAGLRASLRLYDGNDQMIAQIDDGPPQGTNTWQPGQRGRIPLGLPIPPSTPAGTYFLDLIVYDGSNGEPLPPDGVESQRLRLSEVNIYE
ncbi:hypothetical protein GC175_07210 [bacterium]|nr:hypothetical protein [bacterium]